MAYSDRKSPVTSRGDTSYLPTIGTVMPVLDGKGHNATMISPSDGQRRVIEASSQARVFVLAGPGVGKTWTLLQRAVGLCSEGGMSVAEVLLLSFTRAVVSELRRRDRGLEERSRVYPETFDAFASRLLRAHASDDTWVDAGYDGRISAATNLVRDGEAGPTLDQIRHVLLDEVQDLVGVRAEFVAALLDAHAGGITAFGDPAQAIYDDQDGAAPFTDDITAWADETILLEGYRRFAGGRATQVDSLRSRLLAAEPSTLGAIRRAYDDLPSLGDAVQASGSFAHDGRTSAILCRDNVTAIQISDALRRSGQEHQLRGSSGDRPISPWIAAIFSGRSALTQGDLAPLLPRLAAQGLPRTPGVDEAWSLLCRLDRGARGGAVRGSEVRSAIALGRVPWELYEQSPSPLVISTIHRAKGLEFDDCMVVDWDTRDSQELSEEKVLFVALTRAQRDTWHATFDKTGRWYRRGDALGRFVDCGHEKWQSFGIEIRGGDVHAQDPGGTLIVERDASELQRILAEAVRPGDDVVLNYSGEHDLGQGPLPAYTVVHARGEIGVTGVDLGMALHRRLGSRGRPGVITGARVEGLESVTGSPDLADAAGLGRSGIWMRPRLVGLGAFLWG